MPRRVLACDTSTGTTSIALLEDGVPTAELTLRAPGPRSADLLTDVAGLLSRRGLVLADVDLLVTALGPGSFTGVRVGMATMKGLAWATGKPLAGVGTLDALAASVAGGAPVLAALDARKGELYAALFGPGGEVRIAPAALRPEAVAASVAAAVPTGPIVGVGEGVLAARAALEAALGDRLVLAPAESHVVRASVLARLGLAAPRRDPAEIEPLYLRRSEAEVNADARQGRATGT
jgi:tRNA threonylcarbamoyladenosine biosynthesis protein TsaB